LANQGAHVGAEDIHITDMNAGRPHVAHHRFAIAAAAAIATLAISPSVALAASPAPSTYPAVNPSLTVSSASVAAGGSVTVSGVGYDPNETVDITVVYGPAPKAAGSDSQATYGMSVQTASFVHQLVAAHAAADATGAFSQQLTLSNAGTATITATGAQSRRTSSSTVNVMAAAPVASGNKSLFTGSKLLLLAGIPAVVLIVSLILAFRGRRPSSPAPAHAPVVES
jgi:hypothetical protein